VVLCGGCGKHLVLTAQQARASSATGPVRHYYHSWGCQRRRGRRVNAALRAARAAITASAVAWLLAAGSAGAQTLGAETLIMADSPACDPAHATSAAKTRIRHGKLPVCTSASELPLLYCDYTIDGQTLRIGASPDGPPPPQSHYELDVSWVRRKVDYPYTATCWNEEGESEVAEGVARFPAAPAAPVVLP
jgi:hypothetical protein